MKLRRLMCKLFGHKWSNLYDFTSVDGKTWEYGFGCVRCYKRVEHTWHQISFSEGIQLDPDDDVAFINCRAGRGD